MEKNIRSGSTLVLIFALSTPLVRRAAGGPLSQSLHYARKNLKAYYKKPIPFFCKLKPLLSSEDVWIVLREILLL